MSYPYSGRNLFEETENYFYAKCDTLTYLTDWQTYRVDRLADLQAVELQDTEAPVSTDSRDGKALVSYLNEIEQQFDDLKSQAEALQRLEKFIVKYEIFKRLFERYEENLRKTAESPVASLSTYLTFAMLLRKDYEKTECTKYLSTLIKLCDAFCSIDFSDLGTQEKTDLAAILTFELNTVSEMEKGHA